MASDGLASAVKTSSVIAFFAVIISLLFHFFSVITSSVIASAPAACRESIHGTYFPRCCYYNNQEMTFCRKWLTTSASYLNIL
jgi:hypothetical protein